MNLVDINIRNPEKDGLYFCINYKGLVSICEYENNTWYYIRHGIKEKFDSKGSEISWIDLKE
jgi:hypothetical protein